MASLRGASHFSRSLLLSGATNLFLLRRFSQSHAFVSKTNGGHVRKILPTSFRRFLSTTQDKKPDKNIFLDNLGTIFLSAIGLIIASLVRSYRGTANRNRIRDWVEEHATLDPLEIDDLRVANSQLDLEVFGTIMNNLEVAFPDKEATHDEFVKVVRRTMKGLKGDAFTIELGHLVDRVVLSALRRRGKSTNDPMPLTFWLTVLSMALHSNVSERIRILYQVLQMQSDKAVTIEHVREMVGYLQDTCQLVPDSQIVPTSQKYPVQQYECGTPQQLVEWAGSSDVDLDAFAAVLRSKSVCAWGECYHKKKSV